MPRKPMYRLCRFFETNVCIIGDFEIFRSLFILLKSSVIVRSIATKEVDARSYLLGWL